MRKPLLAANWKMYKLRAEVDGFFSNFTSALGNVRAISEKVELAFAVPYPLLDAALKATRDSQIKILAQNVHWENQGAFTGEVSLPMLQEIGIHGVVIGHSERRQYFGETDETVSKKAKAATENKKFLAVVCVGETRAQREQNLTEKIVAHQVEVGISQVQNTDNLVIAYEPVWAIGTGLTATSAEAQAVHETIRKLLAKRYGQTTAERIRILYGGSMKPANTKELVQCPDIDGGLVGGASLVPAEFAAMAKDISLGVVE